SSTVISSCICGPLAFRSVITPESLPIMFAFSFAPRSKACIAVIVDEAVTFDHVQSVRVRRAVLIDHGVRARLDSDGIDHQRAALVMADGISRPGRRHSRGMSLIQAHVA